jgi:small-conductance mechanosensitive channel
MGSIEEILRAFPVGSLVVPAAAALVGYVLCALVLALIRRVSERVGARLAHWVATHLQRPLLLLAPVLAIRISLPLTEFSGAALDALRQPIALLMILGTGWLLIALTSVIDDFIDERFLIDARDNLRARRVHTKFRVLRRTLVIVVVLLTGGAMLMTFPSVRALGAGILASAGTAGIGLGIAARPTVEILIAGVQLALTEPINLDDVVIVEGEWGRIEEINATYVVIRIWDDRRLIVPVNYFLTQPFQNWTRVTAELLGSVSVEVDYGTPVDRVREEVGRIVESSPHWDRRFWNLQVTEAGERTMRLRVLATAGDSGSAWNLRCEIRERLIAHLRERHPVALPRVRMRIDGEPEGAVDPSAGLPERTPPA